MRYFPNNGTTNEVGGIISTTRRKNTWRLIRIEIDKVTWKQKQSVTYREKKHLSQGKKIKSINIDMKT